MKQQYLIIGGTEKSGTTSLYRYLADHPNVSGSRKKETDFFRRTDKPWSALQLADYHRHFSEGAEVRMEASPGYLVDSAYAAPAIHALVPSARLIFVLRDPIERLVSSFEFHKSRLYLPETMSFDQYWALCMRYERGEGTPAELGLGEWFLRVPDAGKYASHLKDFFALFPPGQIKVLALDDLNRDPRAFVKRLADWAGIDGAFYDAYGFERSNVTFAPKAAAFQRFALAANRRFEPFFNRYPEIKQRLLRVYKAVNGKPANKPVLSDETRAQLVTYYERDVAELVRITGDDMRAAKGWLSKRHG